MVRNQEPDYANRERKKHTSCLVEDQWLAGCESPARSMFAVRLSSSPPMVARSEGAFGHAAATTEVVGVQFSEDEAATLTALLSKLSAT
jgi:hypothetical protein